MNLFEETPSTKIGFGDTVRSALGILIPIYFLLSAVMVGLSELAGIPVLLTGSASLTIGVFLILIVEGVRRYVLKTRAAGKGSGAVTLLRGIIRTLLITAGPIVALLAAGVFTHCFGHECGDTDRIMLIIMLVWSLIALALLPMGYRLLTQADWLRPR